MNCANTACVRTNQSHLLLHLLISVCEICRLYILKNLSPFFDVSPHFCTFSIFKITESSSWHQKGPIEFYHVGGQSYCILLCHLSTESYILLLNSVFHKLIYKAHN